MIARYIIEKRALETRGAMRPFHDTEVKMRIAVDRNFDFSAG